MKKVIFVILILIYSGSQALSPYDARYALNATTDLGSLKVGTADFKLELNGNNELCHGGASVSMITRRVLKDIAQPMPMSHAWVSTQSATKTLPLLQCFLR